MEVIHETTLRAPFTIHMNLHEMVSITMNYLVNMGEVKTKNHNYFHYM